VPVERIAPGDVVSVVRPDGIRVRHRVLTAQMSASYVTLTLKGDANQDPDAEPVVVREAQELVWAVPSVGRAAAFLASAQGGFALGCLITAIAMTTMRRR
jgi:signal peptidase